MATITINRAGLCTMSISIEPSSRTAIAEQLVGRQMWRGLMVDGRFYPLILCKHVNANPEAMIKAVDAALVEVKAAIAAAAT